MATSLTVTAGTSVNSATVVTAGVLNALGTPTVSIGNGALPAVALDSSDFITTFGDSFRAINYLPWGAFHYDAFKSGTTACPVGVKTEPVRGWHVQPAGAAITALRDNTTPDTGSGHSLKVYGAASVTQVQVGTYLPPAVTGLAQGTVVFSVYIYNATGSAFTPSLKIYTSTADGDEGSLDAAVTVAGTSCANSDWTRVSFSITAAIVAAASWKKGAHLSLTITAGAGIMDDPADYILVAQAALDKTSLSASWLPNVAQLTPFPPGFQLPWPGDSSSIPDGWLLCDGDAVSRSTYRKLYDVIGTKYGVGDGSSTFNLPDFRGGLPVGAEESGDVKSRTQLSDTGCGTTSGTAYLTVTSTENLRTGMGVYHANYADGTVISSIESATKVKVSANASATASPVTVRFSKLGAADVQTIGTAGTGMAQAEKMINVAMKGCGTATSTTLTVPALHGLACGMVIDCTDVPAGTTIAAFLTATTLRMSAAATGTTSALTATFRVDAPEGQQEVTYQNLLRNPTMNCAIGANPDSNLQAITGYNSLIKAGWTVTGHAVVQSGTYVTSIDSGGTDFGISPATSGAAPGTVELTFSGGSLTSAAGTSILPRMVTQHWMIKH